MDVTVIVAARNAGGTIGRCVRALRKQTYRNGQLQVLVVDDGSTDDTALEARRARAQVLTIAPAGAAAARNRGAERAQGEVLLFTDADCEPREDWVERMVRPFEDPTVSATKGAYCTRQRQLTARFVQLEYERRYQHTARFQNVDFIDTYAAGFRRGLFIAAGGFDETFVIGEDQEFSFRYSRLGGRRVFVPDAVVCHLHVDGPWKYFRKKFRIGFWKMRVLQRHPDKLFRDSHTPQGLKLELVAITVLLLGLATSFHPTGLFVTIAAATFFALLVTPGVATILSRDPILGVVSPLYFLLRAVALGGGALCGLVDRALGRSRRAGAASRGSRAGGGGHAPSRPDPVSDEQTSKPSEEPSREVTV